MPLIYKITNIINNKIYVGKTTKTLEERYTLHLATKNRASEQHRYLYRSMNKHGVENFIIEILEEVSEHDLDVRERYWIKELNSLNPKGYNMTEGGEGGDTSHTPQYREGMRTRRSDGAFNSMFGKMGKNNPNYGKKRTEEQCRFMKQQLQKAWDTNDNRRQKLSAQKKGSGNHMYGKKPGNALMVEVDGKIYDSMRDAVHLSGKTISYIKKNRKILGRKDGKNIK